MKWSATAVAGGGVDEIKPFFIRRGPRQTG
jgi:hypothetical protein